MENTEGVKAWFNKLTMAIYFIYINLPSASSVSSVVNRKKSFFLCKIESEMLYLCIPWKNLSYIYWDAVPLCLPRDILRPLKSWICVKSFLWLIVVKGHRCSYAVPGWNFPGWTISLSLIYMVTTVSDYRDWSLHSDYWGELPICISILHGG